MKLSPKFLFPEQRVYEKVYLITRPHWIVLAKRILAWLLFAAFLLLFDPIVLPVMPFLLNAPFPQIVSLLKTIYLMFLIAALFIIWIIYYLNYQIVTSERIVDMDQKNLLYHAASELSLVNIEDVTAEVKGILGTLFNYGSVYVQTAGQISQFEFDNIPNPHKVAKLILDLYQKHPSIRKNAANQ